MPRSARLAVPAVATAMLLADCGTGSGAGGGAQPTSDFPMTVFNRGHQVTIKHPPKRILVERDTSTTVAAAGAARRLVARSGEADVPLGRYRDQLRHVPQISKHSADPPSREVVLGKRADLVVAGHVTRQHVQDLEAGGVPVLVPSWFCQQVYGSSGPVNFTNTYRTLRLYGRIFGPQQVAAKTVADLQRRINTIRQRFAGAKPRSTTRICGKTNGATRRLTRWPPVCLAPGPPFHAGLQAGSTPGRSSVTRTTGTPALVACRQSCLVAEDVAWVFRISARICPTPGLNNALVWATAADGASLPSSLACMNAFGMVLSRPVASSR